MKNLWEIIKESYPIILTTVIIYQIILCIFFFSVTNIIILSVMIVLLALGVLFNAYKDSISDFFHKK